MNRRLRAPGVLLLVVTTTSCRSPHGSRERSAPSVALSPVTLIVGLDGSTSYAAELGRARQQLGALVRQLPPGSDASVRWITGDSYLSRNVIASALLPNVATEGSNVFDIRARKHARATRQTYADAIEAFVQTIDDAPPPSARATDILGFLVVASERARSAADQPVVVLVTDLVNNVETYRLDLGPASLHGCRIVVLGCAAPTPAVRARWKTAYLNWGATSVVFVATDERMPSGLLSPAGPR